MTWLKVTVRLEAQLSVAVRVGAMGILLHATVRFAGYWLKMGLVVSATVMVWVLDKVLPH